MPASTSMPTKSKLLASEAKPLPDKKLKIKAENPSSDKEKTNPNQIKDKKGASVNTETESEKTLFTDKVNIFIDKIKCTLSKIYAMIESVIEKKNLVADFLSEDHHNAAFMKLLSEIKKLFKKLKPKALKGHILFGFDDPSITGKVLGCISLFYPYIEKNLTITADFENKKLVGNININGRLRISMFLAFLLNLIINKNVRITISDILSLIKKLKQGGK